MVKIKLSFLKYLSWKLFLLSLLIAAAGIYFLLDNFTPYRLNVLDAIEDQDLKITYHDFNNDGYSESLELNRLRDANRYFIQIKNWSGGIIDQTNYWEKYEPGWLMFADITNDGFDEILTFTQNHDSLFFYVHDIVSKKTLISRMFIVCLEEHRTPHQQEANFLLGYLADQTVSDQQVVIFGVSSFTSLKPRNIFALDIKERRIIQQFETNSCLSALFPYDLTGDGVDEIIVTGVAYGNVPYQAQYKDDKCWLFVLDQQLVPVFPPLSFSEYPAEFLCLPVEVYTERYLLVVPFYLGEKNLERMVYLVNAQGKIHSRKQNPFGSAREYGNVLTSNTNPSEMFGWQGNNGLIKLNHKLEIERQVSTPFRSIQIQSLQDLDGDGREEILCSSEKHFSVFDHDLRLLSVLEFPSRPSALSYRETGPQEPLEIGLRAGNFLYLLKMDQNKLYSFLPLLFFSMILSFFLLFSVGYKFLILIMIDVYTFKHLLHNSRQAILVVDSNGKIIRTNNLVHTLLNLTHAPVKGDDLLATMTDFPSILDFLKDCMKYKKTNCQSLHLEREGKYNAIEINVQPLPFPSRRRSTYLVEFKATMLSSQFDKIQTWSRAVQKMAHDIKTPLSTVNLNLKVLQTRLDKIQISKSDRRELADDIDMMRTELENIQSMTKNFLKFSNLDKPHFQAFDIKEIIDEAVKKYQPYLNPEQDIQVNIDKDVKAVWADPQQIELVFNILLENALAAMQGKGIIQLSASMAQYLDKDFLEYLEVEVADTGPGIAEKDRLKIFEPYFTTKAEGTGMGLAIAKKIIEDHGGAIEVHSKPNFGAVFVFSLPVMMDEDKDE